MSMSVCASPYSVAELVDAVRDLLHMFALVARMLPEFLLHALAVDADRGHIMHRVTKYANDLRGQCRLKKVDRLFNLTLVILSHGAAFDLFFCATAKLGNIGHKRLRKGSHGRSPP